MRQNLVKTDCRWVLTVPAIWRESVCLFCRYQNHVTLGKTTGIHFQSLPRRGYCVEELKFYVRPLSDVWCLSDDVCCNHFLNQKSAASRAVFDVSWVQKWSKSDHSLKMNQKSAASRAVIDVSWVQFWSPTTQEPLRGHLALQVLSSQEPTLKLWVLWETGILSVSIWFCTASRDGHYTYREPWIPKGYGARD